MSYSSDLTAVQTNTHTDVTVKTAPASITPANVGTNLEQLVTVLLTGDLNKIISLGGDVQNQLVTFRDPISTLFCSIDPATSSIIIEDVTYKYTIDPVNGFSVINAGTGMVLARLGFVPSSFTPCIELKDSSAGKVVRLTSGTLTADQTQKTIDATGFIPVIVNNGVLMGQTAASNPFLNNTVSSGLFRLEIFINVRAITTDILNVSYAFHDEDSAAAGSNLIPIGAVTADISTTGYYVFPVNFFAANITSIHPIRVDVAIATGGGSCLYNIGYCLTKLN